MTTYCSTAWAPYECEFDTLDVVASDVSETRTKDVNEGGAREGRFLLCDFGEGSFVLVNVYVPNSGGPPERPRLAYKLSFLRALLTRIKDIINSGREVLVVGDFNVATKPEDVHPRIGLEKTYSLEERELFDSFIQGPDAPLVDVWRHLHPQQRDTYTVFDEKTSARSFNEGVRIDYVLASKSLLPAISRCDILCGSVDCLPPKWSDHVGIILEMNTGELMTPPKPHPPCLAWTTLNARFNDPKQRSILAMFKSTTPKSNSEAQSGQGVKECGKRKRGES